MVFLNDLPGQVSDFYWLMTRELPKSHAEFVTILKVVGIAGCKMGKMGLSWDSHIPGQTQKLLALFWRRQFLPE